MTQNSQVAHSAFDTKLAKYPFKIVQDIYKKSVNRNNLLAININSQYMERHLIQNLKCPHEISFWIFYWKQCKISNLCNFIVAKTAEDFIPNSPVTHAKIFEILNYNKNIIKC